MFVKVKKVIWLFCIFKILFLSAGTIFLYRIITSNRTEEVLACDTVNNSNFSSFWKHVNLQKNDVPQSMNKINSSIEVQSKFVNVSGTNIHYLFSTPVTFSASKISLLLLHGQSFSSATWRKLGTINSLAAFGYFTVAVDLPGYGKSQKSTIKNKSAFIDELIIALKLTNTVIISPSMSGSYSIKFLIRDSLKLKGFIPISPMGTNVLTNSTCDGEIQEDLKEMDKTCGEMMHYLKNKNTLNLECIKVPTMIVFGEHDRGENSAKLCHLPFSQAVEIPKGNHPAYLSNPNLWHKILYNFLSVLSLTIICRK